MTNEGTIFHTTCQYVDEESGEILTPFQAKGKNSIYIKTGITKQIVYNHNKTHAYVQYTIKYRRNPQQKLPFNRS